MNKIFANSIKFLAITIVIAGIFAIGWFFKDISSASCHEKYKFINSDMICEKKPIIKKTGYLETQNIIENYIMKKKADGVISEAGIYFRDLVNGPVFGINETTDFAPASLLKLPLALVYLLKAEDDPNILNDQLSVEKPKWSFSEVYPPAETINPLEPHTVEDLLMHMLTYSDNNSYGVLQTHLYEEGNGSEIIQRFLELGFLDPMNVTEEIMSVRQYSSIFRGLYNTSYLNADFSEKVLKWLSESDFKNGIVDGVQKNIIISHKFGERTTSDGIKQLHDCGIIYYPDNPYLLCIMTKGGDFKNLEKVISDISSIVYKEFDSRRI